MTLRKTFPSIFSGLACRLILVVLSLFSVPAAAQNDVPFSGPNEITLNIPGTSIPYSYFSNQLLVRLDQEARKIEFRVPLSSFEPANTGSPQILMRELLLAGQHPDMVLLLDAPLDLLLSQQTQPATRRLQGILIVQGVSRDIETDVYIVPLPDQATMSSTFRFNLLAPNVVLPRNYSTMVQGFGEIVFQNARWVNPEAQKK